MMKLQGSSLYALFKCALFVCYISSLYPWFVLNNKFATFALLFLACITIFLDYYNVLERHTPKSILGFLVLLFCFIVYYSRARSIWGMLELLLIFYVVSFVITLNTGILADVLRFITKSFAILLLISIISFVAYVILGVSVFPVQYIQFEAYTMANHVFFNYRVSGGDLEDLIPRFFGIFLEPGHMTMGLAPLIIVNRFNFRDKYVVILIVAQLLSMSLAGIVVLFVGYVLITIRSSMKNMLYSGACVVGLAVALSSFLGEEMMDLYFYNRIEIQDGKLVGDNRVTDEFEYYYKYFMQTDQKYFGNPSFDELNMGGISGYKKHVVYYGLFGLFFGLLVFLYGFARNRNYITGVWCLVFCLLLYQNAYPLWFAVIMMYVMGIRILESPNKLYRIKI